MPKMNFSNILKRYIFGNGKGSQFCNRISFPFGFKQIPTCFICNKTNSEVIVISFEFSYDHGDIEVVFIEFVFIDDYLYLFFISAKYIDICNPLKSYKIVLDFCFSKLSDIF